MPDSKANTSGTRELLRNLKSLAGPFTPFDVAASAPSPQEQFHLWLADAIKARVPEPHAMTLSTVDEDGHPDARVLLLKNLDDHGWHFASSAASPKGRQISTQTRVALTFYWPQLGRQVRIRGEAISLGTDASAIDFLARPAGSRAGALMNRQSDILLNPADLDAAFTEQSQRLTKAPGLISPSWTVYAVQPQTVEFWQGHEQRRHTRLRYHRSASGWTKEQLWP